MRVLLVEPGKAARPVEMKNDLHEMQQMVGGPIQALYPWEEPVAIVCNDEGKNMGETLYGAPPDCFLRYFFLRLRICRNTRPPKMTAHKQIKIIAFGSID